MPTIQTSKGPISYCVLIPTKGRPAQLVKSFTKMPWLDHQHTYIGIELDELETYRAVGVEGMFTYVGYQNPTGSVAVCREYLRQKAMEKPFDYFVVTDDNAMHKSAQGLENLVRAAAEYPVQPCVMAGYHNTAAHFDRGKIGKARTINGLTTYPVVAMILQCYPRALYEYYRYPVDSYGLDDRHFALHALRKGATFRACMETPFTKTRYQTGGQGPVEGRARKTGLAIARLASDFPEYVGAVGTLRIPWQFLLDARTHGMTANRLVGGSMRKEGSLNKKVMVRKRRL